MSLNKLLSHSRSFEVTLLRRSCVSPYQYFSDTMSVCRTVSEILSVKKRRDLETGCRGRSRSLKMVPFDRSCTTFYWSAIVSNSCMLYHFQVICRWIIMTSKRSLKVIQPGTIHKLASSFLFAFHSNYGHIFNCLWDIQHQTIAWTWKLGYRLFKVIENGAIR